MVVVKVKCQQVRRLKWRYRNKQAFESKNQRFQEIADWMMEWMRALVIWVVLEETYFKAKTAEEIQSKIKVKLTSQR